VTTINIPASIVDATTSLDGLARLLQAKQWERAAIVYAFTEPQQGKRSSDFAGNPAKLSQTDFAALGITGLKDRNQVAAYRKAWQEAIDLGKAVEVKPGDAVTLPDLTWKDHFGEPTKDVQERVTRTTIATNPALQVEAARLLIETDPHAIDKIVQDRPEIVGKIVDGVIANPATMVTTEARLQPARGARIAASPATPVAHDFRGDMVLISNLATRYVRAIETGEYTPRTGTEEMLIGLIGSLLTACAANLSSGGMTQANAALFAQIDQHLKAAAK
jgi:hypothetical protein